MVQVVLTGADVPREALFMLAPWLEKTVEVCGNGGALALQMLALPLLVVMTGSAGLASYRRTGFSGELPPFFLTKPIGSADVVTTKWWFGAQIAAFAWGLTLLMALAWTGLQGMWPDTAARLHEAFGPAWWLLLVAVFLGLCVVSWMWMASGLWAGLYKSVSGTLGGPIGTALFLGGWVAGLSWLSALGVAVICGPALQVLRGWRLAVGAPALIVALGAALAGWPLLAVPIIPLPGMLAAVPALERRRHA
jgi:hypothetical protein